MSRIFISYKRVDKDKVFKIKDQIESALGEKCWIDLDGIESDAVFASKIIGAINDCELFLFMYSKEHRIISDYENDWTIRELNFAQMQKKRVVFVNLDGSELTDWFNLLFGTKQQVDGRQKTSINKLVSDLKIWLQGNSNEDVLSSKTKTSFNRRILFVGVFFTLLFLINLPSLFTPGSSTKENQSTIDTVTQRICKKILLTGMKDSWADYGQVLVMECKTGEIKAMVEIKGEEDSTFEEPCLIYTETTDFDFCSESRMMSYISLLACMETGKVDTNSMVGTGCGIAEIRGNIIKDHNWRRGGYGTISMSRAIELSSDVAVCTLVDSIFNGESLAFYKILEKMNYGKPDTLSFIKAVSPCVFTFPDTPISWLGYNCEIFPIQILSFYNAIANDGVMVKPTVEKIEHPDIIAESIVSDKNLKNFQAILRKNVTDGYGKETNSEEFKVAGIGAGTQIIEGNEDNNYCLQYYAYFPIEAPKYSVLVTLHKKGLPASSGGMCGPIIKDIAEIIYYNKE